MHACRGRTRRGLVGRNDRLPLLFAERYGLQCRRLVYIPQSGRSLEELTMFTARRPAVFWPLSLFILCSTALLGGPALAQDQCASPFPEKYKGKWIGVSGKGESETREQVNTAVVVTDFGHL